MTTVKLITSAALFAVLVWTFDQHQGKAPFALNGLKGVDDSLNDSRATASAQDLEGGDAHTMALRDGRRLKNTKQGAASTQPPEDKLGIYLPSTPYPKRLDNTLEVANKNNNKLELVHIPKTGGTAIEAAAAIANVQWGVCHYILKRHCSKLSRDKHKLSKAHCKARPCWHSVPTPNKPPFQQGKSLFAVIRNPYARVLSEYYCPFAGYKGDNFTPSTLNAHIQHKIAKYPYIEPAGHVAHMNPQSNFVYDFRKEKPLVEHVIFYENIGHELNALFENYNSTVRLSNQKTNQGHYSSAAKKMTVESLTPQTLRMINKFYRQDFDFLGYRMIDPEMGLGSNSTWPGWSKEYDFKSAYMKEGDGDELSGERLLLEYMDGNAYATDFEN